ncbi:MAG: 4'-phosphopantetheinyl transferase family protein [Myxococcota bacterium]
MSAVDLDVWLAWPETLEDPATVAAFEALLDPDERARYDRIRHAATKQEYLVGRALVRTTLSRYDPRPPASWRFGENRWGKPCVRPGQNRADLRFNLSHTRGLVACAVAIGRDVGVDVENAHRQSRTVEIADRFFAPDEVAQLRALPESEQRDRFFDWWTLKESWIKGVGLGLAVPLSKFAFDLTAPGRIRLETTPDLPHDPRPWRFALFRPTRTHRLAAAVRAGTDVEVRVHLRRADPLGDPAPLALEADRTSAEPGSTETTH